MHFKRFVFVLFSIFAVIALSGCESTIKKYDSTFTSKLPKQSFKSSFARMESSKLSFANKDQANLAKPYFMEFRARNALTYGHLAVVFGKLNKNGSLPIDKNGVLNPNMVQITGLHPATPSSVPWSVGHFVPVPAETGPSDGDFEEKYVTARYRVNLTKAEFNKLVRVVAKHKAKNKLWYAPNWMANCIGYMSSIAKDMGLKTPIFAKMPKDYVRELKAKNGGRKTL